MSVKRSSIGDTIVHRLHKGEVFYFLFFCIAKNVHAIEISKYRLMYKGGGVLRPVNMNDNRCAISIHHCHLIIVPMRT